MYFKVFMFGVFLKISLAKSVSSDAACRILSKCRRPDPNVRHSIANLCYGPLLSWLMFQSEAATHDGWEVKDTLASQEFLGKDKSLISEMYVCFCLS